MATLWLPGAQSLPVSRPGGTITSTAPARAVWHTTESGTGRAAFAAVAAYLKAKGTEPHLLWDPTTGQTGQFLPANAGGRALKNDSIWQTNRTGSVCIQIEVMGRAANDPLLRGPWLGFDEILAWLTEWGIRPDWPAGSPLPYPASYGVENGDRDRTIWTSRGGHFGHSQVPGNAHGDPGRVLVSKWTPAPPPERPKPPPSRDETSRLWPGEPFSLGAKGRHVVAIQKRLIGPRVTGVFGPQTLALVKAHQRSRPWLWPADGVVGPRTFASILKLKPKG